MAIAAYRFGQQIYAGNDSLIYHGRRDPDNHPAIIKLLRDFYPSPEKIACFKHEYEILHGLAANGVVKVYALETLQQRWAMILEDFGGQSLTQLGLAGRLEVSALLQLAIKITEALGEVHHNHIIHKDINPGNILLNPGTGQVKLIDFGIATSLACETSAFRNPNLLEGTLAYMSPEQTGRMNRTMDYRTDLYSLGITLYELATGELPFQITDPPELVYAHIARQAIPPNQIRLDLPQSIAEIILKLMAKNAEERYQSAFGLQMDLQECLCQLRDSGKINSFTLCRHDLPESLQIPPKLYGRDPEIKSLLSIFNKICLESSVLTLVTGEPGVGKTALVHEVHKPITKRNGYFIEGKFDQFQRTIPYSAFSQAFNQLCQYFLTESPQQLNAWREKILRAVGNNAQVLIEIIPDLELVLGKQPALPQLGPQETLNRLNLYFQYFVCAISRMERPLVIFIDDLQWADTASLNLLKLMVTDTGCRHLLIIGAYRDNEVLTGHPLLLLLDDIRKSGSQLYTLQLSNLSDSDVTNLINETLGAKTATSASLSRLVYDKTLGNPFFTRRFLQSLYEENLLKFDPRCFAWQWEIDQITAKSITENVVDLLARKICKLPLEIQATLKLAACMGNVFRLRTLSWCKQQTSVAVSKQLMIALNEGLLVPKDGRYKLAMIGENEDAGFSFTHDRIQQAAYSLIPPAEKISLHLQIGQLLLKHTPLADLDEHVLEIVDHLNQGLPSLTGCEDNNDIAHLNLLAGRKARQAAAYRYAFNYFQSGLAWLRKSCWQTNYDLTLALSTEDAEAAYLCGDFETMTRLTQIVLHEAHTALDRMGAFEIRILAFTAQQKFIESLDIAGNALRDLNINIPRDPSNADIDAAMQETQIMLSGLQPDPAKLFIALSNLPLMTDPEQLAAQRILLRMFSAALMAAPKQMILIILKIINLSLQCGNSPIAALAYAQYDMILCTLGDVESGYQFGNLALYLLGKYAAKELEAKIIFSVNIFGRHWKEHVKESLPPLLLAHQTGLETGDLEYASYTVNMRLQYAFFMGMELPALEKEMITYERVLEHLHREVILRQTQLFHGTVLNLWGHTGDPLRIITDSYDETELRPLYQQMHDLNSMFQLAINKLILYFLFGHYSSAAKQAVIAESNITAAPGLFHIVLFNFYDSLTCLALTADSGEAENTRLLEKVSANQKKMAQWAQHAPMNHLHKFHLIEAELCRVLGKNGAAREYYDLAIESAQKNGFVNEEALACELAGQFYRNLKQMRLAQHYLRDAHYAYQRWGALAKVKDLETRNSDIFANPEHSSTFDSTTHRELDLESIIKASQTISGEIESQSLLEKLMQIMIENAGAQRGYLLFNHDASWQATTYSGSQPAETAFPASVIHYVARTKKSMVLDNAAHEGDFTHDPYIIQAQPKSVLGMPLLNQGQITAILYLENNLTSGTFTNDRLAILDLLSTQAAIVLTNARLYDYQSRLAELSDIRLRVQEFQQLTKKEAEIVLLLCQGYNTQGLCSKLFITRETLYRHTHNIFQKLEVANRQELLALVMGTAAGN